MNHVKLIAIFFLIFIGVRSSYAQDVLPPLPDSTKLLSNNTTDLDKKNTPSELQKTEQQQTEKPQPSLNQHHNNDSEQDLENPNTKLSVSKDILPPIKSENKFDNQSNPPEANLNKTQEQKSSKDKHNEIADQKNAPKSDAAKLEVQKGNKLDTNNNLMSSSAAKNQGQDGKEAPQLEDYNGISKFQIEHKKQITEKEESIPKISYDELAARDPNSSDKELDNKDVLFINNESILLTLEDDDVVFGELTEKATLDALDYYDYIQAFWNNYNKVAREVDENKIDKFIQIHDNSSLGSAIANVDINNKAFNEAIESIKHNKIIELLVLIDNYNIINQKTSNGDNLLHISTYYSNYPAAKLMVMKGVNINEKNNSNKTSLEIAIDNSDHIITRLLKAAGAK